VIKYRRIRCAGYAVGLRIRDEERYKILVGKTEGKRPADDLGVDDRTTSNCSITNNVWGLQLGTSGSGYAPVASSCEHGNVPVASSCEHGNVPVASSCEHDNVPVTSSCEHVTDFP
jgi:hypothetical protein